MNTLIMKQKNLTHAAKMLTRSQVNVVVNVLACRRRLRVSHCSPPFSTRDPIEFDTITQQVSQQYPHLSQKCKQQTTTAEAHHRVGTRSEQENAKRIASPETKLSTQGRNGLTRNNTNTYTHTHTLTDHQRNINKL